MRGSALTILFILLMMMGFQAIAQGNGSGIITIDVNGTQTADAMVTVVRASATPDLFDARATELIVNATQTAIANGITGEQNQFSAQSVDATATDEPVALITSVPDNLTGKETQTDTSMNLTLLSLGLAVMVLAIMAGAYFVIATRIEQK